MAAKLTPEQMQSYWSRTSSLMWTILTLWFIFGFGIHFFAPALNKIQIIGFPLGYYMAAQGSLVVFVALCVWNTKAQNAIDDEFGVSDE